jgi:ankyrin repeat protein
MASLSSKLYICVLHQDIDGVRHELSDRNTNVDKGGAMRDFCYYETPLQLAVELDSDEIVELLINAGANVNVSNGGGSWTPLHTTASRGKCDQMRMLIVGGANKEAQDVHGATPLFKAWGQGAELLITGGANVEAVDRNGFTPLLHAVHEDQVNCVEMLLAHHAVVEVRDNQGRSPLIHAANAGDVRVVEMLLAHRAVVDAKDNCGLTPLMTLADSYGLWQYRHHKGRHMMIADMLLRNGADIFAETFDGQTAVTFAAREQSRDLEQFFRLEMDRQKFTAFAMASNDRLGEGSRVAKLDEEMRRMVWEVYLENGPGV